MKKAYILLLFLITAHLLAGDVTAQLKLGDQPTSVQKSVILDLQGSNGRQGVWLPRISDTTDITGIDALNPPDGVMIYHTPSSQVMIRRNGFWSSLQTTTRVGGTTSSHSVIEFQTGNAAGAVRDVHYVLNSSTGVLTLNLPDAAVDTRGVVTTGAQTFGGVKTFNNGLISASTTTVTGATGNASNLFLGINSATTPGVATDRFLSVDNTGRVVLSPGVSVNRSITINGNTQDLSANRTWNVGTVTSITGGVGLTGGTITTSGTLAVDTFQVATRAWRQKGIDSITGVLNGYVPATRTINGLPLSANQTFVTGTTGTDFNISSTGTTHTFNIPSASTTARGLVTTAAQTFAGNKTFSNGATVSGATGNASNLTLGVTSATTAGAPAESYLTVDGTGRVTLNSVNVIANTTLRIKSFTLNMDNLPANLNTGSSARYTFTVPGGGLSTSSTVSVSPVSALNNTTSINWARVVNSNTIEMSISAHGNNQPFTNGVNASFNITVIEF